MEDAAHDGKLDRGRGRDGGEKEPHRREGAEDPIGLDRPGDGEIGGNTRRRRGRVHHDRDDDRALDRDLEPVFEEEDLDHQADRDGDRAHKRALGKKLGPHRVGMREGRGEAERRDERGAVNRAVSSHPS